jgi:hypothetical protein
MSLTYRVFVKCLSFQTRVNGEYFTVSYLSEFLPSNLAEALYTAKVMGIVAPGVYNMSEAVSVRFERVWLSE